MAYLSVGNLHKLYKNRKFCVLTVFILAIIIYRAIFGYEVGNND